MLQSTLVRDETFQAVLKLLDTIFAPQRMVGQSSTAPPIRTICLSETGLTETSKRQLCAKLKTLRPRKDSDFELNLELKMVL